jgi:AcrR family transcriptional regulator
MPKIINHEERKRELLKTGLKLLNSHGKINMRTIAEGGGCSRTTIYNYYKSKEEFISDIKAVFDSIDDPIEKTKYILRTNGNIDNDTYMEIWNTLSNKGYATREE